MATNRADPLPHRPVFVSYVREDARGVDLICDALTAAGVPYWRDLQDLLPGTRWRQAIRDAIRSGSAFLACFSHASEGRERSYMREELRIAVEELRLRPRDRPWFIPIRLEACEIPAIDLGGGESLADLQRLDLFDPSEQAGVERLLAAIEGVTSVPAAPVEQALDAHDAIVRARELLLQAHAAGDEQAVLLHLGKLRSIAAGWRPLRAEIATVAADLLRGASDAASTAFQQGCVDLLRACFSDGTPFTLTADQRRRYPTSMTSWKPRVVPLPSVLDLSGVHLSGIDLSGLRLAAVDFSSATFTRCSLVGSSFECCDFSNATLEACELTDIYGILHIVGTEGNVIVGEQPPPDATVVTHLRKGEPIPTRSWHHLSSLFKFCTFSEARFVNVLASGSCFWACDLSRAQVGPEEWQMRHVDFSRSDLAQASFTGMDMAECLFIGCDLRYAGFRRANLWMATIDTPLLLHAFFEGASLMNVFALAEHKERFLRQALYDDDTILPWPREETDADP